MPLNLKIWPRPRMSSLPTQENHLLWASIEVFKRPKSMLRDSPFWRLKPGKVTICWKHLICTKSLIKVRHLKTKIEAFTSIKCLWDSGQTLYLSITIPGTWESCMRIYTAPTRISLTKVHMRTTISFLLVARTILFSSKLLSKESISTQTSLKRSKRLSKQIWQSSKKSTSTSSPNRRSIPG